MVATVEVPVVGVAVVSSSQKNVTRTVLDVFVPSLTFTLYEIATHWSKLSDVVVTPVDTPGMIVGTENPLVPVLSQK